MCKSALFCQIEGFSCNVSKASLILQSIIVKIKSQPTGAIACTPSDGLVKSIIEMALERYLKTPSSELSTRSLLLVFLAAILYNPSQTLSHLSEFGASLQIDLEAVILDQLIYRASTLQTVYEIRLYILAFSALLGSHQASCRSYVQLNIVHIMSSIIELMSKTKRLESLKFHN